MNKNVKNFKKFNEDVNDLSSGKNNEIKEINGEKYEFYDKFWTAKELGVSPGVICSCGNSKFELFYGNYEINATCTNCGNSDTVYSG